MSSRIKEALTSLCCNNGWSYGVFWRVNRRNSILLTLEDAYYGEQTKMVIEKMLNQVHIVGEGIIGQAAFTGKHQWIFSDTYSGQWNAAGFVDNQNVFQDVSEIHRQFASGIKTIAVISVAPQGVVQFGSTQKILERLEFVDHIKSLFWHVESVDGLILSGNATASFNSENFYPSGPFASVIFSGNSSSNYGNIKQLQDDSYGGMIGKAFSSRDSTQFYPSISRLHHCSMMPLMSNSFHLESQFQTANTEAEVMLPTPSMQLTQVLLQSSSDSANKSVARDPSTSTLSNGGSTLTSLERQLLMHSSPTMFSENTDTLVSCRNRLQNCQRDSTTTTLFNLDESLNTVINSGLQESRKPIAYNSGKLADIQHPTPSLHAKEGEQLKGSTSFHPFPGEFGPANATAGLFKPNPVNNFSQWIASPMVDAKDRLAATLNDDLPQALEAVSLSSGLVGGDVFNSIPFNHATTSVQSSINPLGVIFDGKDNSLNVPVQLSADNDLFGSLGLGCGRSQGRECWDDILMSLGNSNCSSLANVVTEGFSDLDIGSVIGSQKGFFADFGLEQLLVDVVGNAKSTKPSSAVQLSTETISGTANTSVYGTQAQMIGLSCLGGSMNAVPPEQNLEKTTIHGAQKEVIPNFQVGSWIDDSYSINAESSVVTETKRPEELAKVGRKRARPGESTRPRPKDRQQIQDRVKELREIVPNGSKCSIDALLDRTIKHMLFLQSVTKYADKLKQANEPKMIGEESGVVLRDNSSGGGSGATWAFEVGGQTMVCPIIVEDLTPPGQMLVEMLCEERGFFLEIADVIRGFGLTILKGVMEIRDTKIWARFVIEANKDVTRMDIFLSLVQLLQQTATSGIHSSTQPSKVVDTRTPLFTNYQKSPMPIPISLGDRMQR